jgi:uncharacterized protein YbjT (DUF2867 family)
MIVVTGATGNVGRPLVQALVLGRPARTFAEWAAHNIAAF